MKTELKGLSEHNASAKFKEYVEKYKDQVKIGTASRGTFSGGNIKASQIGQADVQTKI